MVKKRREWIKKTRAASTTSGGEESKQSTGDATAVQMMNIQASVKCGDVEVEVISELEYIQGGSKWLNIAVSTGSKQRVEAQVEPNAKLAEHPKEKGCRKGKERDLRFLLMLDFSRQKVNRKEDPKEDIRCLIHRKETAKGSKEIKVNHGMTPLLVEDIKGSATVVGK